MAKRKIIEALRFFEKKLIESGISVSRVILFGSQAQNTATTDSDIDIIVISDDFKNKNIFQRARLIKEAELMTLKKFMLPLDIIALTADEVKRRAKLMKF